MGPLQNLRVKGLPLKEIIATVWAVPPPPRGHGATLAFCLHTQGLDPVKKECGQVSMVACGTRHSSESSDLSCPHIHMGPHTLRTWDLLRGHILFELESVL